MALLERAVVVYQRGAEALLDRITAFCNRRQVCIHPVSLADFHASPESILSQADHVVTLIEDGELSQMLAASRHYGFSLGIIPPNANSYTYRLFNLPSGLDELIEQAFDDSPQAMDLLLCNGEVVMGMLMLGDSPFLDRRSKAYRVSPPSFVQRWWQSFLLLLRGLLRLPSIRHFPVTLTTAKGQTIKTVVTGITVIENDTGGLAGRVVSSTLSVEDGKASVLLISPKSIGEYLTFLGVSLFQGNRPLKTLPAAVSYIRTSRLTIQGNQPLVYYLDGKQRQAEALDIEVCQKAVSICVGQGWKAEKAKVEESAKDTLRLENLPVDKARIDMMVRRLPFFSHAVEEEFKDLFLLLKQNAKIEADYIALMILSVLVANLGLMMNSTAVLIGAMVLAPLMSPIISLSMGLLRNDRALLRGSVNCIVVGVVIALATSALVAMLVPLQRVTPEIAARLQPSLLDLGVAIASGIAGGYAYAREKVMKSLPGVAIAVALVPPLCVAGIGIGWLDHDMVFGAMLLFLTNLAGIALAAAISFLVLGFAPISRPAQGAKSLALSLALTLLLAVPLSYSFNQMHSSWQLEHELVSEVFSVNGKQLRMVDVQIGLLRHGVRVTGDIASPSRLEEKDLWALKVVLEQRWQRPVQMEVGYRLEL